MSGEYEPQPSIETSALVRLGYGHCLDTPLGEGTGITGSNFLDAYDHSPQRQHTEDLLYGFLDMPETDPDYEATKAYLTRFLEPFFGAPQNS